MSAHSNTAPPLQRQHSPFLAPASRGCMYTRLFLSAWLQHPPTNSPLVRGGRKGLPSLTDTLFRHSTGSPHSPGGLYYKLNTSSLRAPFTPGPLSDFSQQRFEQFLLDLQRRICDEAEAADGSGAKFCEDKWSRGDDPKAGYGITRVLEGGALLEKAAANVSIVRGTLSEARAKAMSGRGQVGAVAGAPYFAGALSLVFHSASPMVPTFRSDIRYFEIEGQPGWFGGGADLTPSYLFEEDARDFHAFYKALCERHGPGLYPQYKALCDKYFYIPARKEHRGLGGIFFDDLSSLGGIEIPNGSGTTNGNGSGREGLEVRPRVDKASAEGSSGRQSGSDGQNGSGPNGSGTDGTVGGPSGAEDLENVSVSGRAANADFERAWHFVRDVAEGFIPSYLPIAERARSRLWGEKERQWQLLRRGRYLEFNLLYDRGVKFGLDGGGRVESIMVSAPPLIAWSYNVEPAPGSPEADVMDILRKPRDWA
ncbi:coproporphyrinogen III oxidase [Klebsormidium nitens]|uniref:Coproporphyrinogen III oxidase n=1 Tax=Klebsormidium nitens TaxID=105231 RepID=A0A1Y1I6Q2_KLENI|nr:coproporphyrinogen III oxidase [Klebsormidium nitens]|eukprot:GAQ86634.1 coproporphyrinogen III oxidase [Klebsormidium nitens]